MKIDVKHIAKLANLTVNSEEVKKFEPQLEAIIGYMDVLNELYTKNIETTNNITGLTNVASEDIASQSLSQEEATSGAKSVHNGSFIVDAILEDNS